jgi:hypothetical protein
MLQYGTISWVSSSPFLYALFGYTDRRCEERESYISKDPVLHFFDVVSSPSAGVTDAWPKSLRSTKRQLMDCFLTKIR